MPFALTFTGLLLIITGFQNTYREFGAQVQKDFSGPGNFLYWMISILTIGSLGYIKGLEKPSRAFMALILLAVFLSNRSGTAQGITFFSNLVSGVSSGSTAPVNTVGAPLSGGGGTGGFDLSNIGQDVTIAETVASIF